jgi:hypothetical protein
MADDIDRLQHPYDLALAAPGLEETEFPAHQTDLLEAAITTAAHNRQGILSNVEFFTQPCATTGLEYMEKIYQRNNRRSAIELLTHRHKVDWAKSSYHISNKDPNVVWSTPHHYIDMLVCVSKDIGLKILLPNGRHHTFTFEFKFDRPHREFSAKFAKLGFDAKSSFLWVGKSISHDDVFIAWAPIEENGDEVKVGLATGTTKLSVEHYRMTVMFFAFAFEMLGERGLYVAERYPALDDNDEFVAASNIL